MANIILGVSGSVAAYRAADLARDLMRAGHTIRVCLTDGAQEFVRPALFEALTGQPCLTSAFEEPDRGHMAHIEWARWAELILIAPATANTLVKVAFGLGEDMLTTLILAATCPLVVAPAMNPSMYGNPTTQEALDRILERSFAVVEPTEGDVACGENGQGKLAPNSEIIATVTGMLSRGKRLEGWRVLITSGPTQEPIDQARFLTNRSSGKMGAALARAALLLGANVTVVTGPAKAKLPSQATVIRVRTALEMLAESEKLAPSSDLIIGASAVADYRPAEPSDSKVRRVEGGIDLKLVSNPDIIASLSARNPSATVVGFAAEPSNSLETAQKKLERKGLFALAANDISNPEVGFESDQNELSLLFRDGRTATSGRRSKLECALWLLETLIPEKIG